jgi:YebC/PmpR family DNA-binding regulatory protein
MSGHSKWSTIKRKKGAADAKRGKIFTRVIHELTTAVREGGGGDPDGNPRLRFAIDKAKSVNMPNDTIDRAIKRATGEIKGEESFELTYEGYGPGGTAVLVEVVTNNKNRTVGEVRNIFSKCGGALGESGCVAWMFKKKGVIALEKSAGSEDQIMEAGLEAGADDVQESDGMWEITCDPNSFVAVKEAIEKKFKVDTAEVQMVPSSSVDVAGKEAEQMVRLMELLDDQDDVMNVFVNCNFPDAA